MKKILGLILIGASLTVHTWAADKTETAKTAPITIKFEGEIHPKSVDLNLLPQISNVNISENESSDNEALEKIKEEKLKTKMKFLTENNLYSKQASKAKSNEPILLNGFNTVTNSGCPSDNSLAINQNNQIVVVVNTTIKFYDNNGASLKGAQTIESFFGTAIPAGASLCDPKVIYDNEADRFIVYAQTCDQTNLVPSKLAVAFSQTNDPTSTWWKYTFNGSPSVINSGNCWVDYPKMAVSTSDLFVTSNVFSGSGGYLQSVIYQVDKSIGYAGGIYGNSDSKMWYNITGNPFTIVPMGNGLSGSYGNNMYLVANSKPKTLRLYTISDAVKNNPTLTLTNITIPNYSEAADAVQKGSTVLLNNGDARGMDGYYQNGMIHFVFHCDDGNGFACINYSRITNNGSTWTAQNQLIKVPNTDCCYPAIASAGYHDNDQASIIGYNYCSVNDYPSTAAIYVDKNFVASSPTPIKSGLSVINAYAQASAGGTITNRWGDYSGASRDLASNPPTVYLYTTYSGTSNDYSNYVSAIQNTAQPDGVEKISPTENKLSVFPNPVYDICTINFVAEKNETIKVELFDVQGKFLKEIFNSNCHKGDNQFTFNKGALSVGTYFIHLSNQTTLIKNEKIIVAEK